MLKTQVRHDVFTFHDQSLHQGIASSRSFRTNSVAVALYPMRNLCLEGVHPRGPVEGARCCDCPLLAFLSVMLVWFMKRNRLISYVQLCKEK